MHQGLWESDNSENNADKLHPVDPLSLAKSYAEGMNLQLNASRTNGWRFQFQLSNIRIT